MSKIMKMKAIHNAICDKENYLVLSTMSKIMKMKAIHNKFASVAPPFLTVYDVKDNENESNSQRPR